MKKLLIFGFLLFFSNTAFAFTYNELEYDRKVCYGSYSSKCFYKLVTKYSSDSRYANIVKFDYGYALMVEKEYTKAKFTFQNILASEKENTKLIAATKDAINKINEHTKDVYKANGNDRGNYYNSANTTKWKNNKDIKVCVKGKTGKEYIMKNAFRTWAQRSGYAVSISFVTDVNNADIICFFTDIISSQHAGLTEYKYVRMADGKQYITKAYVKVALTNPAGGKYTDKNLESIALHEAGHALGISGHSNNINDIMYYSTESYKNGTLSNRDINTLKAIYAN